MIIDRIENADIYSRMHDRFKIAFNFLKNVKLEDFIEEKLIIEGDEVFAILNDYVTKDSDISQLEAHEKYIDIQYMIDGKELIGYSPLTSEIPSVKYDPESDIAFYDDKPLFYTQITSGMFSILYPKDLHMPGIKVESPAPIKKIVVKIIL